MLVGFSHDAIGRAVADFLHARGRKRVGSISGEDERAERRNRAFSDAACRLGLAAPGANAVPTVSVPAPTTLGSGRLGLAQLLAREPELDAVFCSSDLLALGVLVEAQARGIEVPRQLAVIGLGDMQFSKDLHPALTTVRIDGTAIGRTAARLVIARSEGQPVPQRVYDLGFSIIERDSA
jgi:LacI family gluconate utilization system Gnt-I transcriptional repressor